MGAWFLRVRPWIAAPPALGAYVALTIHGAPAARLTATAAVQSCLLGFFFLEAYWLYRRGAGHFVTERQLSRSLFVTLVGIGVVCGLTGGWYSPFLPVLLAPTGVTFAAFGLKPWGVRMLATLVVVVLLIGAASQLDPWGPLPEPLRGVLGLMAVLVSAALLLAGVAALTQAHRDTQARLERMRHAVLAESQLRVRDLEAQGARVAHDLKNPLAAITSLLQLLHKAELESKSLRRVEVALDEAERMDRILGDYLTLAKPLRDLQLEAVDVGELLGSLERSLESSAAARSIQLAVELPQLPLEPVLLDEGRVRDALLNLAANALEATEAGGRITLRAASDGDGGELELSVVDDGRGMAPEVLAQVGTPFFTTREGGSGLGVASARSAARQHGGNLRYESTAGVGTVATLTLPRRAPSSTLGVPREVA